MSARVGQAAVWTGKEMIVWGGYDNVTNNSLHVTGDGAAYSPTTNTWRTLPSSPLTARAYPVAVWTGTAIMIVGGRPAVTTDSTGEYADAAMYNPATARWTTIAAPASYNGHNMNWTASLAFGKTILAWSDWSETHQIGPNESSGSGGVDMFSYDESTGAWRHIPASAAALPDVEDALGAGKLVYVRGVTINCGTCSRPFVPEATAIYDPRSNTWTRLPADPLGGDHLLSVWTGAALFSFNAAGIYGPVVSGDASTYNPASNTWTRTPRAPFACDSMTDPVWTGQQILQYCPRPSSGVAAGHDGLAYSPARDGATGAERGTPSQVSNSSKLSISVAAGCPASIAGYRDVVNTFAGPPLVPAGPDRGIVCRYHPTGGMPSAHAGQLADQTRLDSAAAQELAGAIRSLDLRPPTGTFSCPADIGTVALIGLSYPDHADVGLWYAASGCQTLDNGRIGAFQGGNPTFYNGFQGTSDRLAPPVTSQRRRGALADLASLARIGRLGWRETAEPLQSSPREWHLTRWSCRARESRRG
jgi:N-acetylneuraminic acid mutarotase